MSLTSARARRLALSPGSDERKGLIGRFGADGVGVPATRAGAAAGGAGAIAGGAAGRIGGIANGAVGRGA